MKEQSGTQTQRLINVGVTHKKDFPADLLCVSIDIEGHHEEQVECTREYNKILEEVREALMGVGIPREEIKNSNYKVSVHTKQLYEKEDDRYYRAATELDGYDYSAKAKVFRDANQEEAKAIWIALCSCEDPVQFRFNFVLKDREAAKTTLLTEAVEEGKRRADILAAAAGARVTGIHSVSYEYYGDEDRYAPMACYGGRYDDAPEFNPEDITVSCEVKMQWEIEA